MAATGYTPISLYYSSTAAAQPTNTNLVNGELAINITDGKLYYKDDGNVVRVLASKGTATIGGSNTQVQYNSGGILAGSSNLTFDGTTLSANTLSLTNALGVASGGTGRASATAYAVLCGGTTSTGAQQSVTSLGTSGQILTSNGPGALPTFQDPAGGGGVPVGAGLALNYQGPYQVIDGATYMGPNNNYAVDSSKHDIAKLRTNNPGLLNYVTQRVSGTTSGFCDAAYSASDGIYVVVGYSGTIITSPDCVTWTSRTSNTTAQLTCITYGPSPDDLFVAAGASGVIVTSSDGITWTSRTSGTTNTINSMVYNASAGVFVGVDSSGIVITSSDGITWTTSFAPETRNSIAYSSGASIYATVCTSGAIYTTTDFVSWTKRTSGVSTALYGITYSSADNIFVAVGASGVVLTSADGVTWTSRTSGTANQLNAITYTSSLDLFVAVGNSGTIITSSDGVTWTVQTSGVTRNLSSIAYNSTDAIFAAGGASGLIISSPDAVTWTVRALNTGGIRDMANNGSVYVMVTDGGQIYTTSDFLTNTVTVLAEPMYCVHYVSALGLFVAGGNGRLVTSPDGLTWTSRATYANIFDIASIPSTGLTVIVTNGGTIYSSADCITWTSRATGLGSLLTVAYSTAAATFVAAAGAAPITSPDGITWTSRPNQLNTATTNIRYIPSVSLFIAVSGASPGASVAIYSSSDGVTWTSRQTGGSTLVTNSPYKCISYDSSLGLIYVSSGNNSVSYLNSYSSDGINWTKNSSPFQNGAQISFVGYYPGLGLGLGYTSSAVLTMTTNAGATFPTTFTVESNATFTGITYDSTNDQMIAVSSSGVIVTSQDGTSWTRRGNGAPYYPSYTSSALTSVTYNSTNGKTVAVGASGAALYSTNGTTFTVTSTNSGGIQANSVISTPSNTFVTVGNSSFASTSSDGITWSTIYYAASTNLKSLAYSPSLNLYVSGGANGWIATSTDAMAWTLRNSNVPSSTFGIYGVAWGAGKFVAISGLSDANYWVPVNSAILTSTDGITWSAQTPPSSGSMNVSSNGSPAITFNSATGYFTILPNATGYYGIPIKSTDGTTWTATGLPINVTLGTSNVAVTLKSYQRVAAAGNFLLFLGLIGALGTSTENYSSDPVSLGFVVGASAFNQSSSGGVVNYFRTK